MDKTQNPTVSLKNVYAFVDPTAKGEDKGIFHLFVAGKNHFGLFLHNGKKYFLDELQKTSQQIVYYTPSTQTNLFCHTVQSNNFHNAHISNKVVEILQSNNFAIKGIDPRALEAIRPIMQECDITLGKCKLYENLFVCVQKREKNNFKQLTLMDFDKEQ